MEVLILGILNALISTDDGILFLFLLFCGSLTTVIHFEKVIPEMRWKQKLGSAHINELKMQIKYNSRKWILYNVATKL